MPTRTPGETIQRQFRLGEDTLADLDLIADWLIETQGRSVRSRAEAIRYAARTISDRIRSGKNSRKK